MASVKKADKSKKAKAKTARAALKSHRSAAKASKPHEARTRPARAAATRASKSAARAPAKARSSAKSTASTRTKSAAAKLRTAQARLKKQAAAAKAARPAAKSAGSKSTVAKSAPAKSKTKPATQTLAAAKLKPSTHASRGKSRTGHDTRAEIKVVKTEVAAHQTAAPRTHLPTHNKPIDSERRAQAAAVLALRSLRKPAPALNRPGEASKPTVTQKTVKKAPELAPASVAKTPAAPIVAAPAKPPVAAEAKTVAPIAEKPKVSKPAAPVKHGFKPLEFVVYPAHGVGQILAIEEQEVAGFRLELFVISFSKDKMILKVPTPKSIAVGMRKLANAEVIKQALTTLTGRARIKRTMWSRRAQEYEAKINSGDLVAIAEVVRDLYRSEAQPEQSYSERQLYEAALDRVAREIAAVQKLTETESLKVIDTQLQKSPRRGKADEADADSESETASNEDGSIEEAA